MRSATGHDELQAVARHHCECRVDRHSEKRIRLFSHQWRCQKLLESFSYEHREYAGPSDRGIALNPTTLKPLAGVPITRRFDAPYNQLSGVSDLIQASVEHRINENWKLDAGHTELLKPNWSIAAQADIITNDIAPEEGDAIETGIKFDVNKRLSGTPAFHDIHKKNVLTTELDLNTGLNTLRTAGKVRSRGIAFDVTGRQTDNWSAIATCAYTDARVTEDPTLTGIRLQNVALTTGSTR